MNRSLPESDADTSFSLSLSLSPSRTHNIHFHIATLMEKKKGENGEKVKVVGSSCCNETIQNPAAV
jgi:hypothetical protein